MTYLSRLEASALAKPSRSGGMRYAAALRLGGRVIWEDPELFRGPGARARATEEAARVLYHCDPESLMAEQLRAVCDGTLERLP